MSLSHDNGAAAPGTNRLSSILDRRSSPARSISPSLMSSTKSPHGPGSISNDNRSPAMIGTSPAQGLTMTARAGPAEGGDSSGVVRHGRTSSSTSSVYRNQSPPFPPHLASGTSQTFNAQHTEAGRRGSASVNDDTTPPRIRQTRSEVHPNSARAGSSSSSSVNGHGHGHSQGHGGSGTNATANDDSSRTNYSLWLPWEETALIDWLFEPNNCKLFNEPRRKKECHERIIRDILPAKTSRAIEGKIRTLEKRYLKAASEIQRPDFATKHPGKRPDDVSEMLCNNFHKLETIFNPAQAQARSHLALSHLPTRTGQRQSPIQQQKQHGKKKMPWITGASGALESSVAGGSIAHGSAASFAHLSHSQSPTLAASSGMAAGPASTAASLAAPSIAESAVSLAGSVGISTGTSASTSTNANGMLSVPRASPPRILAAESLPHRLMSQTRKIAPKRGTDGMVEPGDVDGPTMMSESKRSRTFPTMMQNRSSPPGHQHHHHHHQSDSRSTPQMHLMVQHQHQQQQQQPQQPGVSRLQRSPMNIQQLQLPLQQQPQNRLFENGRYSLDAGTRPATATLPMMPIHSPMASAGMAQQQQQLQQQIISAHGSHIPNVNLAATTPAAAGIPSIRESMDGIGGQQTQQSGIPSSGVREELEWLQFNLRREELEFRKTVFSHEQELENRRVKLESDRLEIQKKEMDLEARRIDAKQKELDQHVESFKLMTSLLGQMVSQMSSLLSSVTANFAASASTASSGLTTVAAGSGRRRQPEPVLEEGEEEEEYDDDDKPLAAKA
ncbi:hypothetical protein LPJ64_002593 [Coemansia asiatica]|uniref:Uncharacterized protein n=1 Tax=Coemansia asiatica TaxID=1052880 RepID=A0A9W7XJD5_9FUNG|nr:hypothetical protein LPJ64_002593 [Coemansia asiatica]